MDDKTYEQIKENSKHVGEPDPRWVEALNNGIDKEETED